MRTIRRFWIKLIARDIIDLLDGFAPNFLIDSWDNTGFQVGNDGKDVKKILLALDVDEDILDYALDQGVDMIISHHPIFFSPVKTITNKTVKGKLVYRAVQEDIVLYNAHTNLDQAIGGVNDVLADILKLENREILSENTEKNGLVYGYGRTGTIDRIRLIDFIGQVKDLLGLDALTVFGDVDREVERVSVCGGSGASFIDDAYKKGTDVYITGDVKYHDAQRAVDLGMVIIDAGHYHTEKVILPRIKDLIDTEFKDGIDVEVYMKSSPIYKVY